MRRKEENHGEAVRSKECQDKPVGVANKYGRAALKKANKVRPEMEETVRREMLRVAEQWQNREDDFLEQKVGEEDQEKVKSVVQEEMQNWARLWKEEAEKDEEKVKSIVQEEMQNWARL